MPNQPPVWGPHHQQGLPGGIQLNSGGGYWWGITTGTWLAAFTLIGTSGKQSAATAMLIVVMTAAAVAVGWGEAHHGKRFASGHWVLFASPRWRPRAPISCLPWLMWVAFTAKNSTPAQRNRPNTTAAAPPGPPGAHACCPNDFGAAASTAAPSDTSRGGGGAGGGRRLFRRQCARRCGGGQRAGCRVGDRPARVG